MSANIDNPNTINMPARADSIIFRAKTALLQMNRAVEDLVRDRVERHPKRSALVEAEVVAASKTKLWTDIEPEERFLVAGKIQNLRLAVQALNSVEVPANAAFSFWKHVGRASRLKGYVAGRELREGCVIPNIGGGLCQMSNALYDAALDANFEIIERHAHTRIIAGSLAENDRDATVFWNYVDLRFMSEKPFRIEAELDAEYLTIRFKGTPRPSAVKQVRRAVVHSANPRSCATCEIGDCHRVLDPVKHRDFGRTAFLTDEHSPEFDNFIQSRRTSNDMLLAPLDGRRFGKRNYAWTTSGFGRYRQSPFVTALRSYKSRRFSAQGKERQLGLLAMYERLAENYAKTLKYDVLHLVIQQSLLPFLWRNGDLGGRTFDVLMTALPMGEIQNRLDTAHSLHPESPTLGDFRADASLVAAEAEALTHALHIVTPHTEIAAMFGPRSSMLEWATPEAAKCSRPGNKNLHIVFPAATVGRKGCYELREAISGLDATVVLLGPQIEGPDFWKGIEIGKADEWLTSADLVALPAFVEHKPRRLLLAAAHGIPVIASPACGVANIGGIETVAAGDAAILREKIDVHIANRQSANRENVGHQCN